MKLRVIGRYGPFAAEGCCSCYLLYTENTKIVLDMGAGSLAKLQQYVDLKELDAVVLSHLHFDHISDAFVLQYAAEQYEKAGEPLSYQMLLPEAPPNISELFPKAVICTDGMQVKIGDISLTFAQMTHPTEAYAVKAEQNGVFVYSGDTSQNDKMAEFAQNADLFLCDAGLVKKGIPHLTVEEAIETAKKAGAKRTLLTHICPLTEREQLEFPIDDSSVFWAKEGEEYDI